MYYVGLFVVGLIVAFLDAFGIGANDVANSFATSVGSRSLTLKQACFIASLTEFGGAVLLGSNTAETIRGKILDIELFEDEPALLMLGMVCALIGSAAWVIFASWRGWPVSTTHSIVGAIMGVGIAAFGGEGVHWGWSGFSKIVTSWFLSPVAAGLVAAGIFMATKYLVLESSNSFVRGLRAVPLYFGITLIVNVFYVLFKGAPNLKMDKLHTGIVAGVPLGVGLFAALAAYFFFVPWIKRAVLNNENMRWYHIPIVYCVDTQPQVSSETAEVEMTSKTTDLSVAVEVPSTGEGDIKWYQRLLKCFSHGLNVDVVNHSDHQEMHDLAKKYDPNTEKLYSFLQVMTACFSSFAHGSNDVANSVGPLATIYFVYSNAEVDISGKAPVPIWILALGGAGIVTGLLLYGYRVMRSLGNNITFHSPARGFSMELAASVTVLSASKLGLPVSTTHCITGATASVGLCNGSLKAINWKMLAWCAFSWILTVPAAGLTSGILFAIAKAIGVI